MFASRNFLQGSEVPGLVIVTESMTGKHNSDLISRCISNLVIVTSDSKFQNLVQDENRVHCIKVQGIFIFTLKFSSKMTPT